MFAIRNPRRCSIILDVLTSHPYFSGFNCLKYFSNNITCCQNINSSEISNSKFGRYSLVRPGHVSPMIDVPDHINCPEWYKTGKPTKSPDFIDIKSKPQIKIMKNACQLARHILISVGDNIKVGMTTDEIDKMVHKMSIDNGAYPSPLNYKHFPKSVCTSVNNVACHGIPDDRPLHDGDIVTVDVTVYLRGYHGDCSATFLVGDVDVQGVKLTNATYEALEAAIGVCQPGQNFTAIGEAVERVAEHYNYSIVEVFTGHGIGTHFHEPPDIYPYYNDYEGIMKPGMTFTIEPILCQGTGEVIILEDNWTAVTEDCSRTAQWEQTILITETGVEVLTE